MGKNLRQQRRGRGTPRYRSPGHRFLGKVSYPTYGGVAVGKVVDILHAPGRTLPMAVVDFNGKRELMLPAEGMYVGRMIEVGGKPESGNILSLGQVPEGTKIFNIELNPGDGGRFCRSSGSFAILVSRGEDECTVFLPSKQKKVLSARCRATIGVAAASGRTEKFFMRAGNKYYKMKALNKYWPTVRGVAKNPVDHPFGGSAHTGIHKTTSKHMPPGKKVGSVSPSRTGKLKRKK